MSEGGTEVGARLCVDDAGSAARAEAASAVSELSSLMTTSAAILDDESDREWRLLRFPCLDDLPREDRSARGSCLRAPSEWLLTRCSADSFDIGSEAPIFCSNASWKVTADSSRDVVALEGSEGALSCCSLG